MRATDRTNQVPSDAAHSIGVGSSATGQGLPGSACAQLEDGTVKCWGAGYTRHPENLGVPNVWKLGVIDGKKVRLLTTDGKYHVDGTARDVDCNPF